MVPQGFGLIRELFGDEGQQNAFAVFGPVMGLAAIAGPLLGGGLIDLDLLGIGLAGDLPRQRPARPGGARAGRRYLPTRRAVHAGRSAGRAQRRAGDGSAVVALVYPLIQGREQGWPAWSFALLAGGVVTLGAFAALPGPALARSGRTPLVEPSILRRRPYVAGLAVVIGFIGAMGGMMIALNVMYQTGLGLHAAGLRVATVAIPVAAIGGSITSSALLARIGRTTMHVGIVTMAIGLVVVDVVMRSAGGSLTRLGARRPARDHGLRHGDGVRADVRRDPRRGRPARDRVGLRACSSQSSSWRCRSGSPRSAPSCSTSSARPRAGRVRRRRRPRAAGRGGVPDRRLHRRVLAAQARATAH